MAPPALAAADRIAELRSEADRLGVPVVYVNDNYGHWGSDKKKLVSLCAAASEPARLLADRLGPRDHDYFVIKPQLSGFHATNLPVLLPKLDVSRLVLTGFAGDICVLFTAADAHMRAYDLWVPEDAIACGGDERKRWALDIMRQSMGAETRGSNALRLEAWVGRPDDPAAPTR